MLGLPPVQLERIYARRYYHFLLFFRMDVCLHQHVLSDFRGRVKRLSQTAQRAVVGETRVNAPQMKGPLLVQQLGSRRAGATSDRAL